MTCFSKQGPRELWYVMDFVLEEYGWVCVVEIELTAGIHYLPHKSGKRDRKEKVMVTKHLFLPEP